LFIASEKGWAFFVRRGKGSIRTLEGAGGEFLPCLIFSEEKNERGGYMGT